MYWPDCVWTDYRDSRVHRLRKMMLSHRPRVPVRFVPDARFSILPRQDTVKYKVPSMPRRESRRFPCSRGSPADRSDIRPDRSTYSTTVFSLKSPHTTEGSSERSSDAAIPASNNRPASRVPEMPQQLRQVPGGSGFPPSVPTPEMHRRVPVFQVPRSSARTSGNLRPPVSSVS